jgi:chromate reductase
MSQYKIAVIVGSIRKDSINQKLADALAKLAPPEFSFSKVRIDDLPLYNQDDDGQPVAAVTRLRKEIAAADGLLFLTPEYNRSIPGVLKNAIDHASRPWGQSVWTGKPAGVLGISVGAIGTALAQQHRAGAAAPAQHPGLPRCADAGSARSIPAGEGGSVRGGRQYRSGQPRLPARLGGPLRIVGQTKQGLSAIPCDAQLPGGRSHKLQFFLKSRSLETDDQAHSGIIRFTWRADAGAGAGADTRISYPDQFHVRATEGPIGDFDALGNAVADAQQRAAS